MTALEFQKNRSSELRIFLQTDLGREMLATLMGMRPPLTPHTVPHLHAENTGAVRGYEQALRNMNFLANPPVVPSEVKATYGVKDRPEKEEPIPT